MFNVSVVNALFNAPIGLYPQELKTLNQIAVDLKVSVLTNIDQLPFLDYTLLYELIKTVVLKHHKTLEQIVGDLYKTVKTNYPDSKLCIKVRKHHPPLAGQVDYTEVSFEE